jgi:hypothetical protein
MKILKYFLNIIITSELLNSIVVDMACLNKIQKTSDIRGYRPTAPNLLNILGPIETTNNVLTEIITTTIIDCTIVSYYCLDRYIAESFKYVCDVKFDSDGCFDGCSCLIETV